VRFPGKSAPAATASAGSSISENGSAFSFGVLAAMLVCAAAFLGIGASAAGAATAGQSYGYRSDIGTGGTVTFEQFFRSVAVSDDGRAFLVRQFDPNVFEGGFEVVGPDGTSLTQQNIGKFPTGLAVTPDGSALYLLAFESNPIKLTSDGAPTPTYTKDPLWNPELQPSDIAIDPATGDVLVVDGSFILRLDPDSGEVLSSIDGHGASRIAVAPSGDIYALNPTGIDGRITRLGPDGTQKAELDLPSAQASWPNPGIAVNPQNGDVAVRFPRGFASENDAVIRIFTAADNFKEDIRIPASIAGDNASIAFSPDGARLYVGTTTGTAHIFELGTQPGLDGPTISQLTPTGFHLSDSVATGGKPTKARFEYCLASDPCSDYLTSEGSSPWKPLGDQEKDGTFEDDVTGLRPLTDYLVRSYALNTEENVENISAPVSVSTPLSPPDAQTGGATADQSSATLTGTVNSFGGQTTYHFEYGLDTGYGSRVPAVADAIAGNERRDRAVALVVKGLQPGSIYHYRLVATNAAGTTAGADRTFTTLGTDQAAPQRGYEQVTSPDKRGLELNAVYGFQAAPDGGAIEYASAAASADAESAAQSGRYIARRGETNWAGQQSLDPPQTPTAVILNSVTLAVSDDFEHAMSVSPVALTSDATEGAANLYVRNLETGAFDLIGTATEAGAWAGIAGTKRANTFIAGARDFSWVVLTSRYPLLPDAPQVAMYKWTRAGGLSLMSVLPDGTIPTGDVWVQLSITATNRLVSDDGETVAFSLKSGEGGVYRRAGDETEAISISQASAGPSGVQPGVAIGMSRDGRYLVFVSHAQLTDDSTDLTGNPVINVYRYDASSGDLEFLGQNDGDGDGSFDMLAISDDGSTVYFNRPRETVDSENNPFTVHEIAVWRDGQLDIVSESANREGTVFASPNGQYLAYQSAAGSIHLYDAAVGTEVCISCGVGGLAGEGQLPFPERNISNYRPHAVTDAGYAFFDTTRALVAADRNSTSDVYEYFQGRLTLISPGDANFAATLADISPDGRDVYFVTAQGLVGQDTDQLYDIYDARIGGGLAAQNPLNTPSCVSEGCLGAPPAPPVALAPGSAQVRTAGAPKRAQGKRCAKKARKGRGGKARCAKKRGKQHSKKRNAKHNRRAGR
jgi:WD40 repeat protein